MKKLILVAAAAGCLMSIPAVTSATAETTSVTVGANGVRVSERDHDRGYHRGWRRHHASCRTIVKTSWRNGVRVTKRIRTCD